MRCWIWTCPRSSCVPVTQPPENDNLAAAIRMRSGITTKALVGFRGGGMPHQRRAIVRHEAGCGFPSWRPKGRHPRLCAASTLPGVDGGPAPAMTGGQRPPPILRLWRCFARPPRNPTRATTKAWPKKPGAFAAFPAMAPNPRALGPRTRIYAYSCLRRTSVRPGWANCGPFHRHGRHRPVIDVVCLCHRTTRVVDLCLS